MDPIEHSKIFNLTISIWKIFGLWSEKSSNKWFRLYSYVFVTVTSVVYFLFFTLSLLYTPRTVENFATEAIYYFSAFSGITKIVTILMNHQEIVSNFKIIDCKEFRGNDEKTNKYIKQFKNGYNRYFKAYAICCNTCGYTFLIILPLFNYHLRQVEPNLPICKYYFLSDEIRNKYFFYWYCYQIVGLVGTITNNVTIHTHFCGLMYMAITQFKILNYNISNIMLDDDHTPKNIEEKERMYLNKLLKCLRHYEIILKYCQSIQNIASSMIFSQFGFAAFTLCLCIYMFLLPTMTEKDLVFMGCFTTVMLLENFVPSLLGSQLTNESHNLRFSAYSYDWYSRSQSFKLSLMLLVERAQRPVVITGLKMVPLSLETFASIVKTAYSFFTLLSGAQDQSSK